MLLGLMNGMVMQRAMNNVSDITVESDFEIKSVKYISDNSEGYAYIENKGNSSYRIYGIPIGGPYTVVVNEEKFEDIYVGDVWLLAGQSNMQGVGRFRDYDLAYKGENDIRAFYMDNKWRKAHHPLHAAWLEKGSIHMEDNFESVPEGRYTGVGPGLMFAQCMKEKTGVPQGLICSAYGGAGFAYWAPEVENTNPEMSLYLAMKKRFAANGKHVAGMLWYQGEANESVYYTYSDDLKEFVGMMRDIWGDNMAFYNVQITSHNDTNNAWPNIAEIRYEQAELIGEVDNYYLVCTMDYGSNALDSDWAHPRNKKHIGDRLAYVALSQYYGSEEFKLKDYGSPTVAKVEIKGSEALVYFKYVGDGLQTSNGSDTVSGFYSQSAGQYLEAEIAGKNCVKVKLLDRAGNSITGESFRLVYGTGAMADQSTCNLQNSNGIGALSFAYTHVVE